MFIRKVFLIFMVFAVVGAGFAGPFTERGIYAYVSRDFLPANPIKDPNAIVNPLFRGWVTGHKDYLPGDSEWFGAVIWNDPVKAYGPATGNNFDIVSLGDLDGQEIAAGALPGEIILTFGDPNNPNDPAGIIRNGKGYDFAVFENAFVSQYTTPNGSVSGRMIAELAFVEVSSDGENFARFPCVSLTDSAVGPYGTIEISDVYNLAGKHPNSYSICTGTPFNLDDIAGNPKVIDGTLDLNSIRYVRLVDIPGSGDWGDSAVSFIDYLTWPVWDYYAGNHSIYDAWLTFGSGGFDLEAVGVLNEQEYSTDINLDGVVNMADFMMFSASWGSHFGGEGYSSRCDFAESKDLSVDVGDLVVFAEQWLGREKWRD